MTRPACSRADLDTLKTFDRARIFDIFGSFEDRDLSDDAFILRTAALLDPDAVSGLPEAITRQDTASILDTVYHTCVQAVPDQNVRPLSDEERQQAEDLLVHRFRFYDETHQLPLDIDWDYNPGTAHWSHDLNRFSYLAPLTRAYLATEDARFSRKAVDLILDWIAKCDIGQAFIGTPYVFGSYLNEAIHCEAWATCLHLLLPHGQVKSIELLRILKSLHDQIAYMAVVTNGHAGNWPTIGCRGILSTLAALPIFRDTVAYTDYAIRALSDQIDEQVLPDGVQDELTPHYHWCVINMLVGAVRAARRMGRDLEPQTLDVLRRMVHYARQTVVPDHSAQVAFNDSDPAVVPQLPDNLTDTDLGDFLSPSEVLGPELFPYAGVAFLRQPQNAGDLYLAFDGGPYGRAHQHEDKLGFWLFAYGRSFLVDPGRHLYDWSEASYLDYLKSTRAHSTILIDHQGQHSQGRPDTWVPEAPEPVVWSIDDREMRAAAVYDLGYGEENAIHVIHRREFVFVKERFWVIFDHVEGEGVRHVESRFQFAPGDLQVDGVRAYTCYDDANLLLWALPSSPYDDTHVECGRENPRGGWYSKRYGLIEPAPCLSLAATVPLPFSAATFLFPYRGAVMPDVTFAQDEDAVIVMCDEVGEVRVEPIRGPQERPSVLALGEETGK